MKLLLVFEAMENFGPQALENCLVSSYVSSFVMAYYCPVHLTFSAVTSGHSCSAAYVDPYVKWWCRAVFLLPLLKQVSLLSIYSVHSLLLYWSFSHWLAMSHHTSLSSHYWQRVIDNFPWQWARLEESTYLYFQQSFEEHLEGWDW